MGDNKMKKLKDILSEVFDDTPKVDKHSVVEGVRNYGIVGKSLYNNTNIMEVAKQLSQVAESAHNHILGESDDWFDKVSVSRNMKTLKGSVVEFQKTAKEAHSLNQRLTSLYEDIGHVLNRYYEIDEALDKVDPDDVEADDDFEDREDKDIDNDGDTDDSDEYLHKKRQAISKAVKKESLDQDNEFKYEPNSDKDQLSGTACEALDADKTADGGGDEADLAARDGDDVKENKRSLKDIGGVVGIPSLGQFTKKFR
jgi:hypothetical protein